MWKVSGGEQDTMIEEEVDKHNEVPVTTSNTQ